METENRGQYARPLLDPALKEDWAPGNAEVAENPLPVSIIIPTYMRNQVLWRSLEGLRGQVREGDEILVVDQNRPPLRAPEPHPPWLRLLRMEKPSLTRARNLSYSPHSARAWP